MRRLRKTCLPLGTCQTDGYCWYFDAWRLCFLDGFKDVYLLIASLIDPYAVRELGSGAMCQDTFVVEALHPELMDRFESPIGAWSKNMLRHAKTDNMSVSIGWHPLGGNHHTITIIRYMFLLPEYRNSTWKTTLMLLLLGGVCTISNSDQILSQLLGNMGVSLNGGTPKSSILIRFSVINHPFWGTPIFGNTHMESFSLRMDSADGSTSERVVLSRSYA